MVVMANTEGGSIFKRRNNPSRHRRSPTRRPRRPVAQAPSRLPWRPPPLLLPRRRRRRRRPRSPLSPFRSSSPTWSTTGCCGCEGGPRPRATRRAAPWARGGASRASPSTDVPPDRTAPPSTSTRPRPPPAPPPPPPLHLLPRLALEGGHGLPAQLLRGRRHLALRVIPCRLPTPYSPSRGSPHTHPTSHPPASPVVPTAYP